MTIVINYTNKSGAMPETLTNVKSYRDKSLWSVEVIFNDGKIESFYAVESVKELSEPEVYYMFDTKKYTKFIDNKMFDFKKANNIPISVKLDKLPKNQYAMILQFRLDLEPEVAKEIGISMSDKMKKLIQNLIIRLNIDKPKLQLR